MPRAFWISGIIIGLAGAAIPASPVSAQTEVQRPAAFARCSGCHSTEPGKTLFGPSLAGIAGRQSGSLAGYSYSEALKSSGVTWNKQTLDRWLASPQKTIPGTRMPFSGIPEEQTRQEIIRYLLSL